MLLGKWLAMVAFEAVKYPVELRRLSLDYDLETLGLATQAE